MAHFAGLVAGGVHPSPLPHAHVVTTKAVAFGEALRPEFQVYARTIVENAKTLAAVLLEGGLDIVTGGTDTHLMLVDLRPKKLTGKAAEHALELAGITCNKNGIPFDPEKPTITSGVRLGTPAITTRGLGPAECRHLGQLIVRVLDGLSAGGEHGNGAIETAVRSEVAALCRRFPIYPELNRA
jgi:glycine hydroxymethyltransferase